MPLIHSKKPAAFKQNIRTEMHAGKPQKQAVAIAYSEKREAEKKDRKHSYSKGGECHACGGGACGYAEGGQVKHHPDQRMKHERGVNTQDTDEGKRGESVAGVAVRSGKRSMIRDAKDLHRETIAEQRATPGPPSGRSGFAEGGAVEMHAEPDGDEMDMDTELSHGLGKELMDAFESKNHKAVMSALEACVLHCMSSRDGEED